MMIKMENEINLRLFYDRGIPKVSFYVSIGNKAKGFIKPLKEVRK